MHQHAERRHPGDRNGASEQQRPAELGIEIINKIHAAHDEIGISNPYHVDHAENQIKSERKQREHAAEQDAVDDRLEKINIHCLCSLLL